MPKYNIYKLDLDKKNDLIDKLEAMGLSKTGVKQVGQYEMTFYLSKEPEEIDIWWVDVYEEFLLDPSEKKKNKSHFAVFLITHPDYYYAVSMGKSHFYLKEYCNSDFGLSLAERIADRKHLKIKNSKLFGGKRNKSIVTYQAESQFEYDSGESFHYVKAKTINETDWGKVASFGQSAQFTLKKKPSELPVFLEKIEAALKTTDFQPLPRAISVSDSDIVKQLDKKLINALMGNEADASIGMAEASVSGVDFIFIDKQNYKIYKKGQGSLSVEGDLSIEAFRNFVQQNNIDLKKDIDEIKVRVTDEHQKGYTKPVKRFLDYVDNERNLLFEGKWFSFNQSYLDFLASEIDKLSMKTEEDCNYSTSEHAEWKEKQIGNKINYAEAYFNAYLANKKGYLILDRNNAQVKQFTLEKADLYKDGELVFVKIGKPPKLSYVVDQSMAVLRANRNKAFELIVNGIKIKPQQMTLWLVLDRKTKITKLSNVESLILQMKIAEWYRQCNDAGLKAAVKISYKVN